MTLRVGKQGNSHGVRILAQLAADKLGAAQHVRPLVVASELHIAAVVLEEIIKVVGLHYHIVEFKE